MLAGLFLPTRVEAQAPAHLMKVPPGSITASASSFVTGNGPQLANDANVATFWRTDSAVPQWIQFDLGQSRWVGAVRVYCMNTTYWINGYSIYISDEANPADWGEPVKTGNLTNGSVGWQDIPFDLAYGRYLRLVATSRYSTRIYLAEMEVYEDGFVLADPLTGSKHFTGSNSVDVVAFPVHAGYSHYQITADHALPDAAPESWTSTNTPSLSLAYSRPATDQEIVRTVWYTNLAEQVALLSDWTKIVYTTEPPVPQAHPALVRHIAPGYTVVKVFVDDLDTGTSGGTALGLPMKTFSFALACAEDTTPGDPLRVTLDDVGTYDVVLTIMNEAGNIATTTTVVTVTEGQTRTWGGGGANNLASTAGNWVGGVAPQHGDSVLFDATSTKACDWDLNIDLLAWTQTATYSGTVTVWTEYPGIPGGTGFTNLMIAGDAELNGGFWTHRANRGVNEAWDRLSISVAGNFTLGTGAGINLTTKGYAGGRGPGAGVDAQDVGSGASHGGTGGFNHDRLPSPTYGSAARPDTLGSGTAAMAGGGALFLIVGGSAQINGLIQADGSQALRRAGSSGGSIFVQAATVGGTGTLRADGGAAGGYSGGGGRVALIATSSGSLGGIATWARSGTAGANGTAGTIFLQTTAGAELIVNQAGLTPQVPINRVYPFSSRFQVEGELPARLNAPDALPASGGELEVASLSISNKAWVKLTADLLMGDFKRLSSDSTFDLNGHTLFLKAAEPAGGFPATAGGGTILTNGGRIVWGHAAPTVKLEVYTYNSSVAADPVSPTSDGYYALNTDVTLTVTPDANYTFLWWKGDLPAGVARTTHPLTVKLDGRRDLTPVVVRNDGTTHTWTGEGANRNASTTANWYPTTAPTSGQHIVFDATSDVECYWDLNIEPASWTQTSDFEAFYSDAEGHRGFVWVKTLFPGQGPFTNLAVRGDCLLDGGAWTHPANTGVDVAKDRLSVTVNGDFRLNTQAWINVVNRGYATARGPGAGVTGQRKSNARGGSHGGLGNYIVGGVVAGQTYGSITAPTTLGSGSAGNGGGAVLIHASGALALHGNILANADRGWNQPTLNPGPAAGSIYLRGSSVTGSGHLLAKGAVGYQCGGGGRIALVLTNSTDFASLTVNAAGATHNTGSLNSSAGTVYFEGWSNGVPTVSRLIIDNQNVVSPEHVFVELMPSYETYDPVPAVGGEIEDAALEIVQRGRVQLTSSLLMGDFDLIDANSTINLNASTLYLKAEEPAGAFPGDYGGGTILTNDGAIVWGGATIELTLVVTNGPNGTVARNPDSPDDLYEYGSDVLVSATPDAGYAFVYWTGDVPAGSNRTSNPLIVPIDQERTLRALFASTDPATHTWIGDGDTVLASNPTNWYPQVAPTSGVHIVLDATSVKELHWDLDIEVASWTQTAGYEPFYSLAEGYRGWVVIQTKYPGQGTFTNLTITGDCTLLGGTWTHPLNSGDHTAVDRMRVTVGGNLTLGAEAKIDVYGRGYASVRGPGAGNTAQRDAGVPIMMAGSHGGRGGYGSSVAPASCHGSLLEPEDLGSGASGYGGGAVRLDVAGAMHIDGTVDARGRNASTLQPGPAGGSIWLTAATLSGNGTLNASSDTGYYAGGGGRIAVHLADSTSFGNVTLLAHSGHHSWSAVAGSGPGTIVKKGPAEKVDLIIDNLSRTIAWTNVYAELPASIDGDHLSLRDMSLYLTNQAQAGIQAPDVRLRDIGWIDASSRLYLNGHTVIVRSPYHTFTDGDEEVVVVKDGGQLIWTPAGSILILR